MPAEGRDLVLAAAMISIVLQPALLRAATALGDRLERLGFLRAWHTSRGLATAAKAASLDGHAIIVGHGRVGSVIAASLRRQGIPYVVIEQNLRFAERLRQEQIPVVYGDAAWPEVLDAARPAKARLLVIAVPEKAAARRIIAEARRVNPQIELVVRTHSTEEASWLRQNGVGLVVMGEHHIASEMAEQALKQFEA
jgi:CPA2 family monovalent cation:H+ antiporter-2